MVLRAGIEPARPQGTQDFLTCYGFRRLHRMQFGVWTLSSPFTIFIAVRREPSSLYTFKNFMKLRKYTEMQLRRAIKESFSFAQTLKALNLVSCGGNYLVLKRAIAHFDLDISHFTFQLWNKGKTTGARTPTEKYLNNEKSIASNKLKKRLIKEKFLVSECSSCSLAKWLEKPIPLELDHLNGNSSDNRLENLRLLCPNCHALTPTYRGKNIKFKLSSVLPF